MNVTAPATEVTNVDARAAGAISARRLPDRIRIESSPIP
jgi:hypothetical protein